MAGRPLEVDGRYLDWGNEVAFDENLRILRGVFSLCVVEWNGTVANSPEHETVSVSHRVRD